MGCLMISPDGLLRLFLDPVDGTFNAITGIPFYALSIAYAEHGQSSRHRREPCKRGNIHGNKRELRAV